MTKAPDSKATWLPLYRPVADHRRLSQLERESQRIRSAVLWTLLAGGAVCALLLFLNAVTTGFGGDRHPSLRLWSLFPILAIAALLTPLVTSQLWLRPRAVRTQAILLARRGLVSRYGRILAWQARLGDRLAGLEPPPPELVQGLAAAREETQRRINAAMEDTSTIEGQHDHVERERLYALLDAYRLALGNLEIDALLHADFLGSAAGAAALRRTSELLDLLEVEERGESGGDSVPRRAIDTATRQSIAVLPFTDLSPEADQEFFCDGIAEELISALTRVRGLKVVARSSSFSFRGGGLDSRDVGRALEVATVLEGSVRKDGNRVRIGAQLVNVEDGFHLWSEQFDREVTDVFAIQGEIARQITEKLKVELAQPEAAALSRRHTRSLDAYSLYLQGRFYWKQRTEDGLRRSIDHLERAVELDPEYALAFAGLADCYAQLGDYGYLPPRKARTRARAAARRALELDEHVAGARATLAYVIMLYDWDWDSAEREFRRALALQPSYATGHQLYAEFLTAMGRMDEARKRIRQAQELDPLSQIVNTVVAWVLYRARRFDEAVEQAQRVLAQDPSFALAHHLLGWVYNQQGRHEEAMAEAQLSLDLSAGSPLMVASLGYAQAAAGNRGEAEATLERLLAMSEEGYVPPYDLALLYSGLHRNDEAMACLEKAYVERYGWLVYLRADPIWDRLRSEPGFESLVKRVGLDWA